MRFSRSGRFVRTDIWREGDYLDLWSVPHLLSGIALALAIYFLHFGANASFIIAFLLLATYEMWEAMVKIEETRMNRILDVLVGMASFAPTFLLAPRFPLLYLVVAFIVIVVTDSVLSYFGWRESEKASSLEQKFKARYELQRVKMDVRREAMRRRIHLQRTRFKMMKRAWKYQHFFQSKDKRV